MTKEKISEYDASAGSNTDVNGVNIAEGCAPSGINNAIREVMAALKRFETGSDGDSITVGGNLVVSGTASVTGASTFLGATTFSSSVVISGATTATTVSATVVQSDTISEKTSAAGVTVDGVLLKDTTVTANTIKASGTSASQGEVQLFEDTDNGTNYVALKAPASIASDVTFVLPSADGTSGQALVTDGSGTLSFAAAGGGGYVMQTYTSPATWTKPAGLKAVKVTVVGGGGPGGSTSGPVAAGNGSGGGGGGGAAIKYLPAPSIPGPITVTVGGASGTSSFGPIASATGGSAGTGGSPTLLLASGGAGGLGASGDLNIQGGGGGNSGFHRTSPGVDHVVAGNGGGSILGGGAQAPAGRSGPTPGTSNGVAGGAAGGGGSGAIKLAPGVPAQGNGGAGADGVVIVEEFY